MPGSRRYADPAAYLLTPEQWTPQRAEFCRLVGKPADPGEGLAAVVDELHEAVVSWRRCCPAGTVRSMWTRAGIW